MNSNFETTPTRRVSRLQRARRSVEIEGAPPVVRRRCREFPLEELRRSLVSLREQKERGLFLTDGWREAKVRPPLRRDRGRTRAHPSNLQLVRLRLEQHDPTIARRKGKDVITSGRDRRADFYVEHLGAVEVDDAFRRATGRRPIRVDLRAPNESSFNGCISPLEAVLSTL